MSRISETMLVNIKMSALFSAVYLPLHRLSIQFSVCELFSILSCNCFLSVLLSWKMQIYAYFVDGDGICSWELFLSSQRQLCVPHG